MNEPFVKITVISENTVGVTHGVTGGWGLALELGGSCENKA